jgi:hypothetical protein
MEEPQESQGRSPNLSRAELKEFLQLKVVARLEKRVEQSEPESSGP